MPTKTDERIVLALRVTARAQNALSGALTLLHSAARKQLIEEAVNNLRAALDELDLLTGGR